MSVQFHSADKYYPTTSSIVSIIAHSVNEIL